MKEKRSEGRETGSAEGEFIVTRGALLRRRKTLEETMMRHRTASLMKKVTRARPRDRRDAKKHGAMSFSRDRRRGEEDRNARRDKVEISTTIKTRSTMKIDAARRNSCLSLR